LRLGLLIFGTITHPVTARTMFDRSIRFPWSIVGPDLEPIALEAVVVTKD
jgi:hypothetical protein